MSTPKIISTQINNHTVVYHVQVIEPTTGKFRIFCLYEGIPSAEVRAVYQASFQEVFNTSGLRDENGVYYPFSILTTQPKILSGRKLTIVSGDKSKGRAVTLVGMDSEDTMMTQDQVNRAFQLLDLNNDNLIHKEEFIEGMTAAYSTLFDKDAGLAFAYSCITSKDLAVITAMACYNTLNAREATSSNASVNSNASTSYYLNFEDFCSWYMSSEFDPLRELMIRAVEVHSRAGDSPSSLKRTKSRTQLNLSTCHNGNAELQSFVKHCREILCLGRQHYLDLIKVLSGVGKPSTLVSHHNLKKLILSHIQHVGNHSPLDHYVIKNIEILIETMSEIANEDQEDCMELGHVISLFSFCCEEQSTETFAAIFNCYKQIDANQYDEYGAISNDGFASDLILYNHLSQALRLICFFNADFEKVTGCHPEHLAHAIFLKFMVSVDVRRKIWGKLTLSEFIELFIHGLKLAMNILQITEGYFMEMLSNLVGFDLSSDLIDDEDEDGEDDEVDEDDAELTASLDSLEDDQVTSFFVSYSGSIVTVREARQTLGLFEYSTYDVVKYLMQLCDSEGAISQAAFSRGILRLIGEHYIELSVLQRSVADFILDRLSQTFDPMQNGMYSLTEIATALLLFCEDDDSTYARAEVILALLRPKVLKFSTVIYVVTILYKACYCLNPTSSAAKSIRGAEADAKSKCIAYYMQEVSGTSENTATFTHTQFIELLNQVMDHLEKDSERRRKENDFLISSQASKSGNSSIHESDASIRSFSEDGESDGTIPYLNDEAYPPSATVLELRAASSVLGLEAYSADDLIDKLGGLSQTGKLGQTAWATWIANVIQHANVSEQDVDIAIYLSHRIFSCFLRADNEEEAEFSHIAAGLAFLCAKSPLEERLMVAFTILDDDSDGFINYDQLCVLIRSVLSIIAVCSKLVNNKIVAMGTNVEELTVSTAAEAMCALGLQADDDINLEMLSDLAEDYLKLASLV